MTGVAGIRMVMMMNNLVTVSMHLTMQKSVNQMNGVSLMNFEQDLALMEPISRAPRSALRGAERGAS